MSFSWDPASALEWTEVVRWRDGDFLNPDPHSSFGHDIAQARVQIHAELQGANRGRSISA